MQDSTVSKALLWSTRIGIWLLLLTPFVVAPSWFFPYITGKNFFFRIIVELTFGVWLALIIVDARYRPKNSLLLWAFFAFIGVFTFTTITGADPYNSFWSNFERMEGLMTYLHLGALFVMASSVFRNILDWRLAFHISVVASIGISCIGLFELLGIITIPGSTAGVSGIGIYSRLGNQIYLAAYLLFHFFILAFLFFTTKNRGWRIAYIIIALFEFYIFLHTGTRGALIGLAVGLAAAVFALFVFSLRDNKQRAVVSGGLMVAGIVVAALFFMFRDSAFIQNYPLLRRFADINTTSSTAQSRLMIWGIAKRAFLERPLLGWGPGNFIIPYAKYYNPDLYGNEPWFDRVHNMHFEWLVAGGIFGFAAYIGVISAMLVTLWQLWRKRILDGIVVAAIIGFLIAYLGQNTFVFDTIITFMFFTLFLALAASLNHTDMPAPAPRQTHGAVFAPMFIVAGILFASVAHGRQMQVASGIIDMLNSVSAGRTVIEMTRQLDDLKEKNTFGTTEARERFADFLFAAARSGAQISSNDLIFLLSKGIEETKEEVARTNENIKHQITLGKLLQLRFSVTKSETDYAEAVRVYKEAIARAPHFPSTYIGLAEVYLTAGDSTSAVESMESIFSEMMYPSQLFIHSLLLVDVIGKNYERGISHIERYYQLGETPGSSRFATFDGARLTDLATRVETVGGDPALREKFLEALQQGYAWQRHEAYLKALINAKLDLGKIGEARSLAEMLAGISAETAQDVDELLRSLDAL